MGALPGIGGLLGKPKVPLAIVGSPALYGTQTNTSNGGTTHNVTLPTSKLGDLLVMILRTGDFKPPTAVSGWELLDYISNGGGSGGDPRITVFTREADGSEGATQTVTAGASIPMAGITYAIEGWTDIAASPGAVGSSSNAPNPDSVTPPFGAAAQSLVIAIGTGTGDLGESNDIPTSAPSGYGSLTGSRAGGAALATAHLFSTAASFDPGAFSKPRSTLWSAMTLAIQ